MSLNLEQADGTEGTDGEVIEPPPQPGKPKDANSATAVAAPSFSSSRRVKFPIGPEFWMRSVEQRWDDRLPSRLTWRCCHSCIPWRLFPSDRQIGSNLLKSRFAPLLSASYHSFRITKPSWEGCDLQKRPCNHSGSFSVMRVTSL